MNNESWIKTYRKIADNELICDPIAYTLFSFILLKADRNTGILTTTRNQIGFALRQNPTTIYKALQRLEKKYQVISLTGNKMVTEISVSNWAKYQSTEETVTSQEQDSNNNSLDPQKENKEKESNKEKETREKEKYITTENQSLYSKPVKVYQRVPLERATQLQRVVYHLEDTLHTKIVNWGKQGKGLTMLLKAGFTEEQIMKSITYLATRSDFYQDKGFDLITLTNEMPRLMAKEMAAQRRMVS